MGKNCSYLHISWLLLSLTVVVESAASEMNYLPPPTNITLTMTNIFYARVKWKPSPANCTPAYNVNISFLSYSEPIQRTLSNPSVTLDLSVIHQWVDLNNYFSTGIKAYCNDMKSEWATKNHMQLVSGNERTSVKNISCVWHYMEYINCTWQPRIDTPPNVKYKLLYWEKDKTSDTLSESAQLEDLLRTGTECQGYFPLDEMYLGCTLEYKYSFGDNKELMFVVTDTSYSVKPFLYYTEANSIGKLRSPIITYISEVINGIMYINWTASPHHDVLLFEVLVISDGWGQTFKVHQDSGVHVTIPSTDDKLRVKVRAQFSEYIADSLYWSDWSTEWKMQGKDKNTTSKLLLALIPALVVVVAVILLLHLKRLKIWICPPIPHPEKIFQNDLQYWLNSERPATVYNKPELEDVSPVSLLEA